MTAPDRNHELVDVTYLNARREPVTSTWTARDSDLIMFGDHVRPEEPCEFCGTLIALVEAAARPRLGQPGELISESDRAWVTTAETTRRWCEIQWKVQVGVLRKRHLVDHDPSRCHAARAGQYSRPSSRSPAGEDKQ